MCIYSNTEANTHEERGIPAVCTFCRASFRLRELHVFLSLAKLENPM